MRKRSMGLGWSVVLLGCGFLFGVVFSNQSHVVAQDGGVVEDDDPCAGFFPTKSMVNFTINRVTEDMGKKYGFNEVQLENTRAIIREKVPAWLDKNKSEIKTLTNYWIESMMGDAPPTAEEVAEWSKRVMPLVGDFTNIVQETSSEMKEFLNDDQIARLESELGAFNVGLSFVNQRLNTWGEGGYNWETEWVRGPEFRQQEEERRKKVEEAMRTARRGEDVELFTEDGPQVAINSTTPEAGMSTAPPADTGAPKLAPKGGEKKPAKVVDEWVVYIEGFEKRYNLDADQRDKVRSILASLMEQRDRHLAKNKEKIESAHQRMAEAKDENAKRKAAEDYVRLNAPIDKMFEKLKQTVEKVPTRAQRTAAAKAAAASESAAKKSESPKKPVAEKQDEPAGDEAVADGTSTTPR